MVVLGAWPGRRSGATSPFSLPPVEVLLVPAAVGLALATALGVAAFEVDLPGLPLRVAAGRVGGGRGRRGRRASSRCSARASTGAGRCPPATTTAPSPSSTPRTTRPVPGAVAGRPCRPAPGGLGARRTASPTRPPTTAAPDLENLWVGSEDGPTGLLADAVDLARGGETARLGRLLSPMGIRYVVVPERLAPAPFSDEEVPVPAESLTTTPRRPARPGAARRPRRADRLPQRSLLPDPGRGAGRHAHPERGRACGVARPRPLDRRPGAARRGRAAALVGAAGARDHPALLGRRVGALGPGRSTAGTRSASSRSAGRTGSRSRRAATPRSRSPHPAAPLRPARAAGARLAGRIRVLLRVRLGPAAVPTTEPTPSARPRASAALVLLGGAVVGGLDDRRRRRGALDRRRRGPPIEAGVAMPCRRTRPTPCRRPGTAPAGSATEDGFGRPRGADPQPDRRRSSRPRSPRCRAPSRRGPPRSPRTWAAPRRRRPRRPSPRPPPPSSRRRRRPPSRSPPTRWSGWRCGISSTRRWPGRSWRSTAARSPSSTRSPVSGGRATAPCSTTAADEWSFPWGVTQRAEPRAARVHEPVPRRRHHRRGAGHRRGAAESLRFQGFVVPRPQRRRRLRRTGHAGVPRSRPTCTSAADGWWSTASRPSTAPTGCARASRWASGRRPRPRRGCSRTGGRRPAGHRADRRLQPHRRGGRGRGRGAARRPRQQRGARALRAHHPPERVLDRRSGPTRRGGSRGRSPACPGRRRPTASSSAPSTRCRSPRSGSPRWRIPAPPSGSAPPSARPWPRPPGSSPAAGPPRSATSASSSSTPTTSRA